MSRKYLTPVQLPADPVNALEAATKQYVDGKVGGSGYLPLTGGTLTGPLNVTGTPLPLSLLGPGLSNAIQFCDPDFATGVGQVGYLGTSTLWLNNARAGANLALKIAGPGGTITNNVGATNVLQIQGGTPQAYLAGQLSINRGAADNVALVLRSDYAGGGSAGPAIGFYNQAGDTRYAWLQGNTIGMRFEIPSTTGNKWSFTAGGIEQAYIDYTGRAYFVQPTFNGGLSNLVLTLNGFFAAGIDFYADRYPGGIAPPGGGSQKRGNINIDGYECIYLDTMDITGGTGDIVLRPAGTKELLRVFKAGYTNIGDSATATNNAAQPLRIYGGTAQSYCGFYVGPSPQSTISGHVGMTGLTTYQLRVYDAAGVMSFVTGSAEKMRLHANGDLQNGNNGDTITEVGASLIGRLGQIWGCNDTLNTPPLIINRIGAANAAGSDAVHFRMLNTTRGSVTHPTTTTTAYNTSSDYRLKEVLGPVDSPLERLMLLKPCHVRWLENDELQDTFIAHEVAEVVPWAVTGEKDAVITQEQMDAGEVEHSQVGDIIPQQLDASKLIPLMVAAIQELDARMTEYEANPGGGGKP